MSGIKKDRWVEGDILALPSGEHDYFDRKSGSLLTDPDFRKDTANALSAFANSGGGHLVIGVRDDGRFDGVPVIHSGRTKTRDWLEQIIPELVSYPLEDFRVHEVEPKVPSAIPQNMVVIVIDVGDSVLAPHQTTAAKTYYYRVGGRSLPAPHFYLETLLNRLVNPILEAEIIGVDLVKASVYRPELEDKQFGRSLGPYTTFVETKLRFQITNTGRVAAYKWAFVLEQMSDCNQGLIDSYVFDWQLFPNPTSQDRGVLIDTTILPGLSTPEFRPFGISLGRAFDITSIERSLQTLLSPDFSFGYKVVSETSRGETKFTKALPFIDISQWAAHISEEITPQLNR